MQTYSIVQRPLLIQDKISIKYKIIITPKDSLGNNKFDLYIEKWVIAVNCDFMLLYIRIEIQPLN